LNIEKEMSEKGVADAIGKIAKKNKAQNKVIQDFRVA